MAILTISAVLGVAIGDYFYLSALRNLGAGLNAIVGTTFSLSIFILSYLMFGEVIALRGYFGGVLVISGIVIATVEIPHSLQALIILTAISPRLAINIFLNITQELQFFDQTQLVDHHQHKFL